MKEHKFSYEWTLKDTVFTKDKGTVFSCFSCGGGSTMGYKLAGFDVIGCNEIDPKMMDAYITNHKPKYSFLESIETFKLRKDLPEELYNLDILDGSPPCSSFSMAGNREKDWGKEKVFREGQAEQVLDTLFFDFIDLAKELQPKVVVAENVKGLLMGNARKYVIKIYEEFDKAGYYCQHFLLNASKMGVPQRRERVFFICLRKDLAKDFLYQKDMFSKTPKIEMNFDSEKITYNKISDNNGRLIPKGLKKVWEHRIESDLNLSFANGRIFNKPNSLFNQNFVFKNKIVGTLTSKEDGHIVYETGKYLSDTERKKISSFPIDYDFGKLKCYFLIGMSVPPIMTAQIASNIYDQWLQYLK